VSGDGLNDEGNLCENMEVLHAAPERRRKFADRTVEEGAGSQASKSLLQARQEQVGAHQIYSSTLKTAAIRFAAWNRKGFSV
jgi:hypothetical protein